MEKLDIIKGGESGKKSLDISIVFSLNYKICITVSDPYLLLNLKNYLETQELVIYQTRGKYRILRKDLKITKLWEQITEESILCDAGLIDYITTAWLRYLDKTVFDIHLDIKIPRIIPVDLIPKWDEILRESQREDVYSLTRFYGGLAAQHTGYGKTLCMLAILESLFPERCVILVPSSGILLEAQQRGEQFGVAIPHYKWTGPIDIINPMGFLRSKEAENPEAIQWLAGVKHVFTDEAHHLQAVSWDEMFSRFLPNVQRSYGFSASPDVRKGNELSPTSMTLRELGHKSAKILGLSGSVRVRRRSPAKVTLVRVRTEITPEAMKETLKNADWQTALDTMMCRPLCAKVIASVLGRFPDVKFYIPIHKVTTGICLYENLQKEGVPGVFWSEKTLYPAKEDKKENDLSFVKRHVILPETRFLMTTSLGFEGIDIPALAGIIPLIGTSYRMVIQPAGRSVRGMTLLYIMLYDKHNAVVQKQMDKRLDQITNEYDNIEQTITLRIT